MKETKEIVKSERRFLSPFDEMEKWLENVWARPYSLFHSPLWPERSTEAEELLPSVDIYEEGNELIVKTDLPGVKKEDLQIDIADNLVRISGKKEREEKVKSEHYYRFERAHGSFSREFELPSGMDTEKARAHYANGVLEVRIPRSGEAAAKSRKISIE